MRDTSHRTRSTDRQAADRRLRLALLLATLLLSLAAVLLFDRASAGNSLFTLGNLVGPTAETLAHAHGLSVCTEAMGTPGNPICFHAARMPLPSAVVALGARLLGNRYLPVALFKTLLLLLPLWTAILLATRRLPRAPAPRALTVTLLLTPFLLTPFLADVVNLQVEEGYSYSLLALAFALLLFPPSAATRRTAWPLALLFGLSTALLYLAKSSMLPAVAVLTLLFLIRFRRPPALAALFLILLAPAAWALWQHHAAGRYTLGTSLDGINLHKGNNPTFLLHYPPPPGDTLDRFDADLSRGHTFPDEWTFNDFHQHAAVLFLLTHPRDTALATERKLIAVLFTVRKLGSEPAHGPMAAVELFGLVTFRLLLWAALLLSLRLLLAPGHRFAATAFLLLVAAVALPYLLGFAYTRHISVLLYPSALLLARTLQPPPGKAVH